jgi:uncharacterized protein YjiS (DUF1127 family)
MNTDGEYYRAALAVENGRRMPYYGLVDYQMHLGSALVFVLLKGYVLVSGAVKNIWRWYATRQTCNELSSLNDHMLQDIGFTRSEIPVVSRLSAADPSFSIRELPR